MLKKLFYYGLIGATLLGLLPKKSLSQINRTKSAYGVGDISIYKGRLERGFLDDLLFPVSGDVQLHTPSKTNNTLFFGLEGVVALSTVKEHNVDPVDRLETRIGYHYEKDNFNVTISADYYPYHFNNATNTFEGFGHASVGEQLKTELTTYYNISEGGFGAELEANYEFDMGYDIPIQIGGGVVFNSDYYQTGTGIKGISGKIVVYMNEFKMFRLEVIGFYNTDNEKITPYEFNELNTSSTSSLLVGLVYNFDARREDKRKISCKELIKIKPQRR